MLRTRWAGIAAGGEQRHSAVADDQGAAPVLGRDQRQRLKAWGGGRLESPAVVGDAAALQLVVVEHGLAWRGDGDQPEAAVGDRERLGHLGPVDRVPVGQGEPASLGQGDAGHLPAELVGDHDRRVAAARSQPGRQRQRRDGHHGQGDRGDPGPHVLACSS
jgi:hypothetical protein